MTDSILNTIKKSLGDSEEDTHYDSDIIMHINSAFMILNQLGVGRSGFHIEDAASTWSDFIEDSDKLEAVKTYVYLKVRLVFDPPTSSTVLECMKEMIKEYEWRLNVAAESNK